MRCGRRYFLGTASPSRASLSLAGRSVAVSGTNPVPDGVIETTAQTSVTQYGITWTFDQAYQVGQFANGDYFVVNPGPGVVLSSVSPAPAAGRNGTQRNPGIGSQALDNRGNGYNATGNGAVTSFPVTLSTRDSVISSISWVSGSQWDGTNKDSQVFINNAAILTVMATSPPTGTLRPAYMDRNQTLYNVNDIDSSFIPSLSTTGMSASPTYNQGTALAGFKRGIQRPWLFWGVNSNGRAVHPAQNMFGYHRNIGNFLSNLFVYLISDRPKDSDLVMYLVQMGLDMYHMGLRGNGDSSFWPLPMIFAGKCLNDSAILNCLINSTVDSVPRDFADFFYWDDPWNGANAINPGGHNPNNHANISIPEGETYLIDGTSYTVFFRNNLQSNREYEHLTEAERDFYGMSRTTNSWVSDESYRTSGDSVQHIGMCLAGLAMDLVTEWAHDATFGYCDRWISGEGRNSNATFIDQMWAAYRGNYQSFPYLA